MGFLLLQDSTAQTSTIPLTVPGVIIAILVVLIPQLPGVIKTGRGWIESLTQEHATEMKSFEKQMDQTNKLFKEIERRDTLLEKLTQTNLETQRLSNEQREQFNLEMQHHREEMHSMVEQVKIKDTALEALAKENQTLRDRVKELETENGLLRDELGKHSPTEPIAVAVVLPVMPPSSDDPPSSSSLTPGVPP